MYKNIITVILSSIVGIFLAYCIGVFYYYINLEKISYNFIKNEESLYFHEKYTKVLHHLKWSKKNSNPEDFLFTILNKFENKKKNVLIQGDSYVATLTTHYKRTDNLLRDFSKKNNIGLINAGIGSYSPSLMNIQIDILEKDFNIFPNILIAYFDQSDLGDEICRYKDKRVFNDNGKLVKVREEKYSRNIFNYTKLHNESRIFLSKDSNLKKTIQFVNFNIKYSFMKQKYKMMQKIEGIKKFGWKGKNLKSECNWAKIEKPLIDNNPEDIAYFKKTITDYLEKINKKKHIEKIIIVTFPHQANLFPVKNQFDQKIYYKVSVAKIIDEILNDYNNIIHLNFSNEIKGQEKYFYDNAYIDFDPHLKEDFHYNTFAKKILETLKINLKTQ